MNKYSDASSLSRHKKKCKSKPSDMNLEKRIALLEAELRLVKENRINEQKQSKSPKR
jgi:hypothetical protein